MAHYARVNTDNIVVNVTPIPNEIITDENGVEHEEWAFQHLYITIPHSKYDKWVQTSINNNFRKRYALPGYTWNQKLDAFIDPKPYESWIFNESTCEWEAPIPMPQATEEGQGYQWVEDDLSWVAIYAQNTQ